MFDISDRVFLTHTPRRMIEGITLRIIGEILANRAESARAKIPH
jgi:hypothetical protein